MDSSILYAKQRLIEMINLPMTTANSPQTTLVHPPAACELHNDCTLQQCGIPDAARLTLSLPQSDMAQFMKFQPNATIQQHSPPTTPPGPQPAERYARIAEIWASNS